jgi:AAA domain
MSDNPAQIVRFWHAVEMFSPQALPRAEARNHVIDFRPGDPLPWEPAGKLGNAKQGNVWRHEVFAGVYDLSKVRDVLVRKYGEDDPEAASVRGQSALFACTVDADGYLRQESGVVSACAWAIGQVERGKPTLTGFRGDAEDFTEELRKRTGVGKLLADSIRNAAPDAVASGVTAAVTVALAPGGPLAAAAGAMAGNLAGKLTKSAIGTKDDASVTASGDRRIHLDQAPLTGTDLFRFTADLARRLGVTTALDPRNIRVNSYQISQARADEQPEQPTFLNSYIVDDLALVSTALDHHDAGTALAQYLTANPSVTRTDVQLNPLDVRDRCSPDRVPLGRWVTSTERPLAFSQQFAVNQIIETLGDSAGLFAVNGPPGTGKTTMLRDVIAAVIVRRAIALASLDSPSQAFTTIREPWQTATYSHTITAPNPTLTGFEMVVASSNNGAVENVTNEIPGPKGIDEQWRPAAAAVDYFSTAAGAGSWAMMAARLGNRVNRNAFVQDFWFSGDASMRAVLNAASPANDWRGAVAAFRTAVARVTAMSAERTVVARAIARLPGAQRDRVLAEEARKAAREHLAYLQAQLPKIDRRSAGAHLRWQQTRDSMNTHWRGKPGWFAFLSARRRKARQAWNAEHAGLGDRFAVADQERVEAERAADELKAHMNSALRAESKADASLDQLGREVDELRQQVASAQQQWGDHVPDGPQYAQTQDPEAISLREKSAPWADLEFTAARTELFLAALRLHKALVLAEAAAFRRNLSALMDILAGKGRPSDEATLAAWQTFFLLVPVVSTTFASFDRLFGGLGRESVGWLFVDEAGQAPPQYAVGALWRARRAVIVGDPLQLKPVVTLPWGGQRALLREFDAGEQWAPSRTSVQQVADRLAAYGTALPGPATAEPVWVGTPLRVHRRCERPMFDICNQIAYDGLMVYGTPERGAFHGRDTWYDISSTQSESHWVPAEGEALQTMLSRLRDAGIRADQIRVISPFRLVATKSAGMYEAVFPDVSADQSRQWVGTVHTMQGKEADVVILILGGDPTRPGARRFATAEPNLLNVAVSRARRRLYVIGSRDYWGGQPYFDMLAARIPRWRPGPQGMLCARIAFRAAGAADLAAAGPAG